MIHKQFMLLEIMEHVRRVAFFGVGNGEVHFDEGGRFGVGNGAVHFRITSQILQPGVLRKKLCLQRRWKLKTLLLML